MLATFDPVGFKVTSIAKAPLSLVFASDDPDFAYGMADRVITRIDLRTNVRTPLLNLNDLVPGYPQYTYRPNVSGDGTRVVNSFGGIQDTYRYCAWRDTVADITHLLDIQASTVDGQPTNLTLTKTDGTIPGIHSQGMDMSGQYVSLAIHGGTYGLVIWDTVNNKFYGDARVRHGCMDYGNVIVQNAVNGNDTRAIGVRPLPDGKPVQMIVPDAEPPHSWNYAGHISCGAAKPGQHNPIVGALYRDNFDLTRPWAWLDDEIFGVATDEPGTVWRFAHHRSIYVPAVAGTRPNFWDSPRGNLSQDGRFYIFTSNWERTLGKGPGGRERQDVFLLELPLLPLPQVEFTATPLRIASGQPIRLTWSVSDAATVSISGIGNVASSGSLRLIPAHDTMYTLTADGSGGEVARTLTVRVVLKSGGAGGIGRTGETPH